MTPRLLAPAYPKLFRFCVAVLGATQLLAGFYWLFAPDNRSSSAAYTVIREDMRWINPDHPLHAWAALFLIAGAFVTYGVIRWKPPFAEIGLLLGAGVWTFFAAGICLESVRNVGVSNFGPLIMLPLIILHLAFIIGLGNSPRGRASTSGS